MKESGGAKRAGGRAGLAAVAVIVAAVAAVYANALGGPFVFDDLKSIADNPGIRRLSTAGAVFGSPLGSTTVGGRPVLSYSFALNYAWGGYAVRGYHVANVAIHLLAALLLFDLVRRTLGLPTMRGQGGQAIQGTLTATWLALAVALLWALHPLQTAAVTLVVQRAESLAALFYLLVLYGVLRGATARGAAGKALWYTAAVAACGLGMATKEFLATAPVLALLYDRIFLAGSWRRLAARRGGLYLMLASLWGLLAALMLANGARAGTVGFAAGVSPWHYALTQCGAIVHYLRLAFWPSGLCLDYGDGLVHSLHAVWPQAVVVLMLVAVTLVLLWRWPKAGFLGAFFLGVLAPTSSFVPLSTQTVAEHRMYLPLAAVAAAVVLGGYGLLRAGNRSSGQWSVGSGQSPITDHRPLTTTRLVLLAALVATACVALGVLTHHRNTAYASELSIWEDTAANAPENPRAQNNYGGALAAVGRPDEAEIRFQRALALKPGYADAENNLGNILLARGEYVQAAQHFRRALQGDPGQAKFHNNLASALMHSGQSDEAVAEFRRAVDLAPDVGEIHYNLAGLLSDRGQADEAMYEYRLALEAQPNWPSARFNLAMLLAQHGRGDEAVEQFRQALRQKPDWPEAQANLGILLYQQGQEGPALEQWQAFLRAQPDNLPILNRTAWVLATSPDAALRNGQEALRLAQRAVQLSGRKAPPMLDTLAAAYAETGQFTDAVRVCRRALDLATDDMNVAQIALFQAHLKLYQAGQPLRAVRRPPPAAAPSLREQGHASY